VPGRLRDTNGARPGVGRAGGSRDGGGFRLDEGVGAEIRRGVSAGRGHPAGLSENDLAVDLGRRPATGGRPCARSAKCPSRGHSSNQLTNGRLTSTCQCSARPARNVRRRLRGASRSHGFGPVRLSNHPGSTRCGAESMSAACQDTPLPSNRSSSAAGTSDRRKSSTRCGRRRPQPPSARRIAAVVSAGWVRWGE
jgi:hypothetical protein